MLDLTSHMDGSAAQRGVSFVSLRRVLLMLLPSFKAPEGYSTNEMSADTLQTLGEQAEQLNRDFERDLLEFLDRLERVDPDLVARTLQTLDDRSFAAQWLTSQHRALNGLSPLQAVAKGRRAEVIAILGRIECGICS